MIEHPAEVPDYALEKISSVIDDAERSQALSLRAGVRHVCSTDAGTPFNPHGSAPLELARLVAWGMRPLDAMVAATSNGAELLRVPDVGVVRAGALADLVLYDANPVDDIDALTSPRTVWKGGSVVAGRRPVSRRCAGELPRRGPRGERGVRGRVPRGRALGAAHPAGRGARVHGRAPAPRGRARARARRGARDPQRRRARHRRRGAVVDAVVGGARHQAGRGDPPHRLRAARRDRRGLRDRVAAATGQRRRRRSTSWRSTTPRARCSTTCGRSSGTRGSPFDEVTGFLYDVRTAGCARSSPG